MIFFSFVHDGVMKVSFNLPWIGILLYPQKIQVNPNVPNGVTIYDKQIVIYSHGSRVV